STPGCCWSGKGPQARRSVLRCEGGKVRTTSTRARTPSTAELIWSPVVFAFFQSAASPIAQAGCAADCSGTCTCRSSLRGSAERKAMSSLERFPQAAQAKSSARALQTERIIHSGGKLGVSERLVLVDVVEEVVHPAACDGRE